MADARPMLGDIELQLVQEIETGEDQVLARHDIPALEGDFLQGLGRRATRLTLTGVLTGPEAGEGLKTLRDKFRGAEPVAFVTDITTATRVNEVLIEEMGVRELAGKPERFEYAFTLREYSPAAEVEVEQPPDPEPPDEPSDDIDDNVGTLIVKVIVDGQPDFDFSQVTVTVQGTTQEGEALSRTLTNREGNVWTEENAPASRGEYTVSAVVTGPPAMSGSATTAVQAGQKATANPTLRTGVTIAKAFIIHFKFDKAFIEPCMRHVMKQVATYAADHPQEKLLIVGHTDKVGDRTLTLPLYNQSLSERRARSAYAYLTFGHNPQTAVDEWTQLRQRRTPRQRLSVNDSWGVYEYQYMLQELDYYPGEIDGDHGSLTDSAVEAFRCANGLPPGQHVDDPTWEKLIEKYLAKDPLNVSQNQFFSNAKDSCSNGIVKWLGCGEEDPLPQPSTPTEDPHRQYRRVEFLFINTNTIPCDNIPEPDTFNLPPPDDPNPPPNPWCLGTGTSGRHCCFLTRDENHQGNLWLVQPIEPTKIDVNGSITFEGFEPNKRLKFRLNITAPDGEYLDGENSGGSRKGLSKGKILESRTDASGNATFQFTYSNKPVGFYTLEIESLSSSQIRGPFVIHLSEESATKAKGNSACKLLSSSSDLLNVTAPNVPALREIRLPVVVHLMTARVETFLGLAMIFPLHQTSRTEADIKRLFEKANAIWRPARIEFEVKDVVELSYEPPAPVQTEVTESEFNFLMTHCSYPNAINVFFVENLVGQTAYFAVSRDRGSAEGGCVLRDLDNEQESVEFLAQAMGSVLNLSVLTDPATLDRLMHFGTNRTDTRLIDSEVSSARSSKSAQQECFLLTVNVTGATQVGGPNSPNYFVVQQSGEVLVEAEVPPEQLALGTLVVRGGNVDLANPHQSRVDRNTLDRTEVTATFTMNVPASTGAPPQVYTRRIRIFVVSFDLEIEGRGCPEPVTNEFITQQHPTEQLTIVAKISRLPTCIPDDIIQWIGGQPDPDDPKFPLQVKVSKPNVDRLTVSATLAGTTRSTIIRVIQIEMIENPTAAAPAITFARVGLWDNAFSPSTGNLRNGVADGNNFISLDSRKFHFRVRDPGASGEIKVRWRTIHQDGTDDDAPASQDLTLLETGTGTGVFISKAVFLVTDQTDRDQRTNSGMPATHPEAGPRNRGQSNHRIRRITVNNGHQLDNRVLVECSPALITRPAASISIPVFNRTPEERHRIRIHLINVRRFDDIPSNPKRANHMSNWLECIRTRAKPHLNEEIGYKVMVGIGMGVAAYRHNKVIRFDPQTEKMSEA